VEGRVPQSHEHEVQTGESSEVVRPQFTGWDLFDHARVKAPLFSEPVPVRDSSERAASVENCFSGWRGDLAVARVGLGVASPPGREDFVGLGERKVYGSLGDEVGNDFCPTVLS